MSNVFTHSNIEYFVSKDPLPNNLNLAQFKAISNGGWIKVGAVGSVPESGITTNELTYDTVDTDVALKAKGISNAGGGTIECARNDGDLGQQQLNAAGQPANKQNYGTKLIRQDGTVLYNRCLIAGPNFPGGRNEDFDLVNYTTMNNQVSIVDSGADATVIYDVVVTDTLAFTLLSGMRATTAIAAAASDTDVKAAIDAASFTATASTVTGSAGVYVVTLTDAQALNAVGATVTAQ